MADNISRIEDKSPCVLGSVQPKSTFKIQVPNVGRKRFWKLPVAIIALPPKHLVKW